MVNLWFKQHNDTRIDFALNPSMFPHDERVRRMNFALKRPINSKGSAKTEFALEFAALLDHGVL